MLISTIHAHTIGYYFYRNQYLTICNLQVISIIFSWIQSTNVRNIEARAVVCFN